MDEVSVSRVTIPTSITGATMPDQSASDDNLHELVADARRASADRLRGYRARALELFPPVCAKCAREFSGKHIRELTVHHRDHNHDNNPLDGSNWELLCLSPVTSRSIHDVMPLTQERIQQATSGHRRPHTGHLPT